ncbi:MAG TPA: hypothetical protein VMW80_13485 [Candidatus Dormibacteraeota bacterium]|nr:hypothetical protein [Candidatus Dormibacteraeota bacterium]
MKAIGCDLVRNRLRLVSRLVSLGLVVVVAGLLSGAADAAPTPSGRTPPEIAANAATGWPAHTYDVSNSCADLSTDINATNVATLKQKGTFKLSHDGSVSTGERNHV